MLPSDFFFWEGSHGVFLALRVRKPHLFVFKFTKKGSFDYKSEKWNYTLCWSSYDGPLVDCGLSCVWHTLYYKCGPVFGSSCTLSSYGALSNPRGIGKIGYI